MIRSLWIAKTGLDLVQGDEPRCRGRVGIRRWVEDHLERAHRDVGRGLQELEREALPSPLRAPAPHEGRAEQQPADLPRRVVHGHERRHPAPRAHHERGQGVVAGRPVDLDGAHGFVLEDALAQVGQGGPELVRGNLLQESLGETSREVAHVLAVEHPEGPVELASGRGIGQRDRRRVHHVDRRRARVGRGAGGLLGDRPRGEGEQHDQGEDSHGGLLGGPAPSMGRKLDPCHGGWSSRESGWFRRAGSHPRRCGTP